MAFLLLMIASKGLAQDFMGQAQHWRDVKIPSDVVQKLLSPENCYGSADQLAACMNALNTAQRLVSSKPAFGVDEERPKIRLSQLKSLAEERLQNTEHEDFLARVRQLAEATPEVPAAMVLGYALTGYMQSFDPHAYVLPTRLVRGFGQDADVEYVGFGFDFEIVDQKVIVEQIYEPSPAKAAGLKLQDQISAISWDGRSWVDLRQADVAVIQKAFENTAAKNISIRIRRGDRDFTVSLKKSKLRIPTVTGYLGQRNIGYIRVRNFDNQDVCSQVASRIQDFESRGARRLVLDLRGNSGGERGVAVCVASLFLGLRTIVGAKGIATGKTIWYSGVTARMTTLPLVVAVDAYTASAAEIVAGSLKHHKRAYLVGSTTWGKATSQMISTVAGDSNLSIAQTNALLLLPGGRTYQGSGIVPHFIVDQKVTEREADVFPSLVSLETTNEAESNDEVARDLKTCVDSDQPILNDSDAPLAVAVRVAQCL